MPKCKICSKAVYPMDPQINLDGSVFHKPCAKCEDCKCQITLSNFAKHESGETITLLCKTHYFRRFREDGSYLGGEKFAVKAARDLQVDEKRNSLNMNRRGSEASDTPAATTSTSAPEPPKASPQVTAKPPAAPAAEPTPAPAPAPAPAPVVEAPAAPTPEPVVETPAAAVAAEAVAEQEIAAPAAQDEQPATTEEVQEPAATEATVESLTLEDTQATAAVTSDETSAEEPAEA